MAEPQMSVSGRATAGATDLQAVLDDPKVQKALRRAVRAGRDTYRQAQGKSPGKRSRTSGSGGEHSRPSVAFWQLVEAIEAAQARRERRRGRRAVLAPGVLAGRYGAYLALNGDGPQMLRNLISHHAGSRSSSGG